MANGHGGTRQGAGRKTNETHIIRRTIEENGAEDAQAAFSLLVSVMNNPANPAKLRVEVAQMVMDRVLGKPKQVLAGAPSEPIEIQYVQTMRYQDYYADPEITGVAPRPIADSTSSSTVQVAGDGPPLGEVIPGS